MLVDGIIGALHNFATAGFWISVAIGTVIGLTFGIIPGISGMLAISLLLPFVLKMAPEHILPMMMTISSLVLFGGAISAILINLPGTPGNAATLLDGFPMARNGEAGRAIGAAEASSALGNISTSLVALALIPIMLPIILTITSAELVFIMLLGITFIAVLSYGSMIKGILAGVLGLIISLIGYQDSTGIARLTFGSLYLYDGIPLVPVALGLFGVPEMIALATTGGAIAKTQIIFKGMADVWRGVKDTFRHWQLLIRSNIIGFIIGIIPGLGASSACFIAYAQAKQVSKHPEKFGTGYIEGVIAPESANNAVEAGALLTTVSLGIPGSAIMALVMGAMMMQGLKPGPEMLSQHLDLSLTLIWTVTLSGIIGAVVCLPLAPYLAKIAFIPGRILVPLVIVIAFVGAFAYGERMADVIVLVVFTALGLVMRRYDFNRPALFLAYILGDLFEQYFFIALKTAGPFFFMRPISLILIAIIIGTFTYGPIKRLLQRGRGARAA